MTRAYYNGLILFLAFGILITEYIQFERTIRRFVFKQSICTSKMLLNIIQVITTLMTLQAPPPETIDMGQQERAMQYIDSNVDETRNPCENFQEFACGHFGINNLYDVLFQRTTPLNKSTHSERYANVDKILLEMLTNSSVEVQATRKAKLLFARCTNEDAVRSDGDLTLIEELKAVGFAEFLTPFLLVSGQTMRTFDYTKAWANLLKRPSLFAKFFMFSVNVIEDPQNPGSYVPLILMNPAEDQTLFRFDDHEVTSAILKYPLFRPATIDADEEETLSKIVARLQRFRSHLKKITEESTSANESPIPWAHGYTRTTLAELQNDTDTWMSHMQFSDKYDSPKNYNGDFTIDWSKFFDKLFDDVPNEDAAGQRIDKTATLKNSSNFVIYVSDKSKLKSIVELLAKTETKTFVLALWLATVTNTVLMGPPQLQPTKIDKVNAVRERKQLCLAIIKDTFRPVVAHELIRYLTEDDKIAINELITDLKNAFLNVVHDVNWLTGSAKDHIFKRIETLRVHVPYINTPRKARALDDIYRTVDVLNKTFYQTYAQILRVKRKNEFSKIFYTSGEQSRLEHRPPVDIFPNAEVVKYYQLSNEIEISLVALGRPYYYGSDDQLAPVNLGALGFHLVRQMVRALGDVTTKIILDKPTYLWTNDDESKFKERIAAATKLLSRTENYNVDDDPRRWKIAQLEAAADNISLNVCFRALYGNISESGPNAPQTAVGGNIRTALRIRDDPIRGEYFTLGLAMTTCKKYTRPKTTYVNYDDRVNEIFKHWQYFQFVWTCYEYGKPMISLPPGEEKFAILSNDALGH